MSEPVLAGSSVSNVYEEHVYRARVTFGAGTVSTIRAAQVTVTRPSSTTLKLPFPTPYTEVSDFKVGRFAATGVAGLEWIITTNNISTTGDVTLTSINSAGTATAPAAADVAYITVGVARSVLNDRFTDATA